MVDETIEKDSKFLSAEEVRKEVDRITLILGFQPPKEIILKRIQRYASMPHLRDEMSTIELFYTQELDDCAWQIGHAYLPYLTKQSGKFTTRHPKIFESLILLVGLPYLFAAVLLLDNVLFPLSIILASFLQIAYILAAIWAGKVLQDRINLVSETMLRIGGWSEEEAENFRNDVPKALMYKVMTLSLVIVFIVVLSFI